MRGIHPSSASRVIHKDLCLKCCKKRRDQQLTEAHSMHELFSVCKLRDDNVINKPIWKMKHVNSILESCEYFCQMASKLIYTILIYTASKLVHFLRHSVVSKTWLSPKTTHRSSVFCLWQVMVDQVYDTHRITLLALSWAWCEQQLSLVIFTICLGVYFVREVQQLENGITFKGYSKTSDSVWFDKEHTISRQLSIVTISQNISELFQITDLKRSSKAGNLCLSITESISARRRSCTDTWLVRSTTAQRINVVVDSIPAPMKSANVNLSRSES